MFSGNNSAITWGFKRYQLCLQGTSHSAKQHQRAAMGHWVSLLEWSVVGWLIVYQEGNYLYRGQYSQTICQSQIGWYHLQGRKILRDPIHKAVLGEVITVENLFLKDLADKIIALSYYSDSISSRLVLYTEKTEVEQWGGGKLHLMDL
jgi:hypothetical protein